MPKILGLAEDEEISPKILGFADDKESQKMQLKDIFGKFLREKGKTALSQAVGRGFSETPAENIGRKVGYGAIPFAQNLPTGAKEGFTGALGALIGREMEKEPVSDEYGAGAGRMVGHMLGQGVVAAPIASALGAGGAAIGIPKLLAELGGTGLAFGATTPGDIIDRGVSGLTATGLHGAGKLVSGLVKGDIPLKELGNRVKNALNVLGLRNKRNLTQEELEAVEQEILRQSEKYDPITEELEKDIDIGTAKPTTIARKANIAKEEAEGLRGELAQEPEMDVSQMPLKPLKEPVIDEMPLKEHESLLKTHEQKAAQKEREIKSYLGEKEEHGVPIAEWVVEQIEGKKVPGTKKRIGGLKNEIGSQYDEIERNLKDLNIELPRTEDLEKLEKDARQLLEKSRPFFKNEEEFENTVKQYMQATKTSGGRDIVPANEFLRNYRSLRQLSQRAKTKAYEKGKRTQDEREELIKQAQEMEKTANEMENVLEQHELGGEVEKLKAANKRWREEITPLYDNKVYKSFLNEGYSPSKDLIYALRGNKEGQVIIRNLIKKNPEMTRRIIGMSHARDPESLFDPRELTQEYLKEAPDIIKHIDEYKGHLKNIEETKNALEAKQYELAQKKKEAGEIEKSNVKEEARREKTSKKYKQITDLENKVKRLEEAYRVAEKINKRKDLTLKEKIQAKKEAEKAEKEYKKAKKDLSIALGIATVFGARKIKKFLGQ